MITWMKEVKNFRIAEIQPQFNFRLLIFCQSQLVVAYKSDVYKKSVYLICFCFRLNIFTSKISNLLFLWWPSWPCQRGKDQEAREERGTGPRDGGRRLSI